MPELSNVLRQRLASVEEPPVHPDADTLTAYGEQLLAAPERTQVLEHLAACGQCREVMLLLSVPQSAEPAAIAKVVPERARWWRPAWGLAASAAGLAIVTAVILELPRGPMQFQKQASQHPVPASSPVGNAPAFVANESGAATPSAGVTNPAAREIASATRSPNSRVAPDETARLRQPPPAATVPSGTYVNVQMFNNDANNVVPYVPDLPTAPAPRLNAAANSFNLNGSAPLMTAPAPYESQSGQPLHITTPATGAIRIPGLSTIMNLGSGAKIAATHVLRKPVPPINAGGFAPNTMGGAGQLNPKDTGLADEVAAVRASDSKDKDAALARTQAFSARAVGQGDRLEAATANVEGRAVRGSEFQPSWKVSDSKLLKLGDSGAFSEAYPAAEGIEFSTVTSHGAEVWAGGGNAALVHSRDAGGTWERITLGASATGAINSIEVSGVKVVVRSSSGQSWSSADGGRTWVLHE